MGKHIKAKSPGRHYRTGLTVEQLYDMVPNEEAAEEWFEMGRGTAGKKAVVGVKDRKTKRVRAKVVDDTTRETLHNFIEKNVEKGSQVYTDEAKAYKGLVDFDHESVAHSVGEYVREMAHTNGIEAFWSMLKRGYVGTYHKMSSKHLRRYINEFKGRHDVRPLNTLVQMTMVANNMDDTHLPYRVLIRDEYNREVFEMAELTLD